MFFEPLDPDLIKKVKTINEETCIRKRLQEIARDMTDAEYDKFFKKAMDKFGIDDITDLKTPEEKKKFFDYVDANAKSDDEKSGKDVEPEDKE